MDSINERVKFVRKSLKMNQTEFGRHLALSQNSLSQIEVGTYNVTDKIVKLICFQFKISEHWLRTGEGNMFVETADDLVQQLCAKYSLDSQAQSVLECFLELSDTQRAAIVDFAKAIARKTETAQED